MEDKFNLWYSEQEKGLFPLFHEYAKCKHSFVAGYLAAQQNNYLAWLIGFFSGGALLYIILLIVGIVSH